MKQHIKWAMLAILLLLISCTKGEKFSDPSRSAKGSVSGYILPVVDEDEPATKASFTPDITFSFEMGDHINIWSDSGTLLIYSVETLTPGGGAIFDGGGFDLSDGCTYCSTFPLITNFLSDRTAIPVSFEGQVQAKDNNVAHLSNYAFLQTFAVCENGSTSFVYHHIGRWYRFELTLPENMTVTELTLTADRPIYALRGTLDATNGDFTATEMSDSMTLRFNNAKVNDGVLNAAMALAPFEAANVVVSVKDNQGNVYSSPVIAQSAGGAGGRRTITQTLTREAFTAVARIGLVNYPTLAAAVAAVPADGTPTTITMIGDVSIYGPVGIQINPDQNVILDLNGHTVAQTGPMAVDSYLIQNFGSLTIKDSSDSAQDGTGGGKMTVNSETTSFLVNNTGVLNVESGFFEVHGSSSSRVIFNVSGCTTSITGGKLKNTVNSAYVVEMYLTSTDKNNILNIGGTAVFEGRSGVWICYGSDDANKGELNITGGTFNTAGRAVYASQDGPSTSLNAAGLSVNISGGYFGGGGVSINAFSPLQYLVVSGGHFSSLFVLSTGGSRFIRGGEFESVEEMVQWRLPEDTPVSIGRKVVYDDDLYFVVPMRDPRPSVSIFPDNIIAYWWEGSSKSGYDFYAPFEGPDPILCADEYLELVMDINLTRDVTYVQSAAWCTPIYQGGTFYLKFGEFDINLNGYAFPLPTGVSVRTDRRTGIFRALEAGHSVMETIISDGDYHYQYSCL